MEWLYEDLFYFTAIVIILKVLLDIYCSQNASNDLPNGPKGLPFVGFMPFLGQSPHKTVTKLSEKYGNVFT